jgi:large subunit ribosomal protein L25
MAYPRLTVTKRKVFGKKVKTLRQKGILPGNLYGKKIKSQALEIGQKDFTQLYQKTGDTGIIELVLQGEKLPRAVLVQNTQLDPVSGQMLHVDFRQVDLKEKIIARVPVEITGSAPAVNTGGVMVQLLNEVEVEALPADLPDKLTIDVSPLTAIDQFLTVADLKFNKTKVELKITDPKALVVKIEPPAKEEVEVKPVVPEGEAAVEGEEKGKEEGKEETKGAAKPEEKKEETKTPTPTAQPEKPKEK